MTPSLRVCEHEASHHPLDRVHDGLCTQANGLSLQETFVAALHATWRSDVCHARSGSAAALMLTPGRAGQRAARRACVCASISMLTVSPRPLPPSTVTRSVSGMRYTLNQFSPTSPTCAAARWQRVSREPGPRQMYPP